MADPVYILQTQVAVPGAPDDFANLDPILDGRTDFFRFLYDTTYGGSYPGGDPDSWVSVTAPVDGATVYDISAHGDAHFRRGAGQVITYAGGGFELNGVTGRGGGYLEIPASVNADLYAAAPAGSDHVGESQAWAECHYLIWPNAAAWTGISGGTTMPIIHSTAGSYPGSAGAAERLWVALGVDGTLYLSLPTAVAGYPSTFTLGNLIGNKHRGLLTQILVYRMRDGTVGVRLKSSAGTDTPATVNVAANAADYSALTGKVGVTSAGIWPTSGLDLDASPFRLFRGWIGNLSRQEIDPVALADEDYADVLAVKAADPSLYSAA